MFKKIRSKDRDTTVIKEIRKEFSVYFDKAQNKSSDFLQENAKAVFVAMLVLIVTSLILCFIVFRPDKETDSSFSYKPKELVKALANQTSEISDLSSRAIEIFELKRDVKAILDKGQPFSERDSIFLEEALDILQQLEN